MSTVCEPPPVSPGRRRLTSGTVEGWLALFLADGMLAYVSWWVSNEQLIVKPGWVPRDQRVMQWSVLATLIGLTTGFALGGIQWGNRGAKLAGYWALRLLVPLLLMMGWLLALVDRWTWFDELLGPTGLLSSEQGVMPWLVIGVFVSLTTIAMTMSGMRWGNGRVKLASYWALAFLMPLLVLTGWLVAQQQKFVLSKRW
jgi:hypothetical protein